MDFLLFFGGQKIYMIELESKPQQKDTEYFLSISIFERA